MKPTFTLSVSILKVFLKSNLKGRKVEKQGKKPSEKEHNKMCVRQCLSYFPLVSQIFPLNIFLLDLFNVSAESQNNIIKPPTQTSERFVNFHFPQSKYCAYDQIQLFQGISHSYLFKKNAKKKPIFTELLYWLDTVHVFFP